MKKELNRTEKALAEALPYWCCKKSSTRSGRKRCDDGALRTQTDYRLDVGQGASQSKASAIVGLPARTFQHWKQSGEIKEDGRKTWEWSPHNKLIEEERTRVLSLANSDEFTNRVLHQIVPILVERGDYIASESSFYRILKAENQLTHLHPSCVPNGMRLKTKRHKI